MRWVFLVIGLSFLAVFIYLFIFARKATIKLIFIFFFKEKTTTYENTQTEQYEGIKRKHFSSRKHRRNNVFKGKFTWKILYIYIYIFKVDGKSCIYEDINISNK